MDAPFSSRFGLLPLAILLALHPTPPAPPKRTPRGCDFYGDLLPPGAVARLGSVRFRTNEVLRNAAFSPDGKTLATDCFMHDTIVLWDVATGKELRRTVRGGTCLAWSADGKILASGWYEDDHKIYLCDAATGACVRELAGHTDGVDALAWSPDGQTLASAGSDHSIRLWRVATGGLINAWSDDACVSLAWSPDGKKLASASAAGAVCLREPASGRMVLPVLQHANRADSVAWSADGKMLASAGAHLADIWDPSTGRLLRRFPTAIGGDDSAGGCQEVAWSPRGHILACADSDLRHCGTILVDADSGRVLRRLTAFAVVWSPDGRTLASCHSGTVRLWDTGTGREVHPRPGHFGPITTLAWSPDGQSLASGGWDRTVRIWEVATAKELRCLETEVGAEPSLLAWSSDGKDLKVAGSCQLFPGSRETLCACTLATGRVTRQYAACHDEIERSSFSPDGEMLATVTTDNAIHVWDAATDKETSRLVGHANDVLTLAWSPDGRTLASAGRDQTVRLWEAATGKQICRCSSTGQIVSYLAWSPDGSMLAAGGIDDTVRIWRASDGRLLGVLLGHHDRVTSVAWSADCKTLASGSADKTVRLWEVATGSPIRTLSGHSGEVSSLAFSPDGRHLATGSRDTTCLIWDVER